MPYPYHCHAQKVTNKRLKSTRLAVLFAGASLACLAPSPSAAGENGYVATGLAVVPAYEGAGESRITPLALGEYRFGSRSISFDGLALKADLIADTPRWALSGGPLLAYRFGREDADDAAIAALAEVSDAVEAGAFAGIARKGVFAPGDRLGVEADIRADISGAHDGAVASIVAVYGRSFGENWAIEARSGVVFADRAYMDAYFGVSPGETAASGFASYAPGGGLKNLTTTLTVSRTLSSRWSLVGVAQWDRLSGDAADSPFIADGPGTERQLSGGLALARSF